MVREKGEVDFRHFEPTLAARTLQVASAPETLGHLLFVESGKVSREHVAGNDAWQAPCLAFLPGSGPMKLVVEAGSNASLIGLARADIDESKSANGELLCSLLSAEPRGIPVERRHMARLAPLLAGLAREREEENGEARTAIEAYVTLILIETCRLVLPDQGRTAEEPGSTNLLFRFRQLVERHFRSQRSIAAYAGELGITTDRLHDICRRTTGRAPLQLVHERLTREAALNLERSTRSIQEIADTLGFRDATYFSHFFKRQTGLPPAAYRRRARVAGDEQRGTFTATYADWP